MPKWRNCPHSLWASTLTMVAPPCPRGVRATGTNVYITHVTYGPLVHASGVHEGAEHGARWAENVENCSKWLKMRTLMVGADEAHARLGPECAIGLVSSHMRPTYLLGVAQPLRFWEWQGRQVSPSFGIVPNRQHGGHGMPSPRGVICCVQDMLGTEVCTSITYLGHDVN